MKQKPVQMCEQNNIILCCQRWWMGKYELSATQLRDWCKNTQLSCLYPQIQTGT